MFYDLVFKNGLVLSQSKMEIGKIEMEFLGFKIQRGQVILQKHVRSTSAISLTKSLIKLSCRDSLVVSITSDLFIKDRPLIFIFFNKD